MPTPSGTPEAREESSPAAADVAAPPTKVERTDTAMGTQIYFAAYTNDRVDAAAATAAIDRALGEMRRLESILSEWRDDSDVGRVNREPGTWVSVRPETVEVIDKALWMSRASGGAFDITFHAMRSIWKFGASADTPPRVPSRRDVDHARSLVDYRLVELDREGRRVRIPKGRSIGLGGIAKGYIVDRAVAVLKSDGLRSFLVQAGGDLYGAGRKPDGSTWLGGIQDPRAPEGNFFATIEFEDHAFSTAGDYARAYLIGAKRYHHIIDPRTGYPATASRSVTVYAPDALTADMIDDAVFILGPERGQKLADSLDGVGIVIVDAHNKVWVSSRLADKVVVHNEPTDGP